MPERIVGTKNVDESEPAGAVLELLNFSRKETPKRTDHLFHF